MIVAVSSKGDNLNSMNSLQFGRAEYFIIIDTETMQFKAVENPNVDALGGAGIQSAQLVISHNIDAVISGSFGHNALRVLQSAGISMFETGSGVVKDVVDNFISNRLAVFSQ